MKKRMVTLIVFLLTACMLLTGCSSATTANPTPTTTPVDEYEANTPPTEAPNTGAISGMHSYEVGGVTLQCKTRVEDYINGNDFRYFDLARDLGWHAHTPEQENDPNFPRREFGNEEGGGYIWYSKGDGGIVDTIVVCELPKEIYRDVNFNTNERDWGKLYTINGKDTHNIYFEQIVVLTYILENYKNDYAADIFQGIFYWDGTYHVQ